MQTMTIPRRLAVADGLVAPGFVWSALDCPTGYVTKYAPETGIFSGRPILLGRLSVHAVRILVDQQVQLGNK
ncbi:hypothetical protein [Bradyrhizobium sp. URHC0002]